MISQHPIPEQPAANAPRAQRDAYEKHQSDSVDVACLMLVTMVPEIQKNLENKGAYEIITHLREMFQVQARQERYETAKALYCCKMAEGQSVSAHVLKMQGYIDHLARLGFPIVPELATDLILHSLPRSYDQFILNFNMNGMEKTISELHGMLKTAEVSIKKAPSTVLLVQDKGKGKGKGKRKGDAEVGGTKPAARPNPPPAKKAKTSKDAVCFFCQKPGHWRRNCKLYMEDLKKKKNEASTSGIFVIGVHLSTPTTWVLDTACGSHICTNVQGLRRSRKLDRGEVDLRVGNGARVAAVAVGTYELVLPTGLILSLNNCYYVPCLSSNIISLSYLDKEGFICMNGNGRCSIYKDNVLYAYGDLHNNHYILELKQRHNNIYNIDTKRTKVGEPNPTYLWRCHLGHINERRLEKLHRDGLLRSFDF